MNKHCVLFFAISFCVIGCQSTGNAKLSAVETELYEYCSIEYTCFIGDREAQRKAEYATFGTQEECRSYLRNNTISSKCSERGPAGGDFASKVNCIAGKPCKALQLQLNSESGKRLATKVFELNCEEKYYPSSTFCRALDKIYKHTSEETVNGIIYSSSDLRETFINAKRLTANGYVFLAQNALEKAEKALEQACKGIHRGYSPNAHMTAKKALNFVLGKPENSPCS